MTTRQERQANRDRLMLARLKELAIEHEAEELKKKLVLAQPVVKPKLVVPETKPVAKKEPAKKSAK